MNKLKCTHTKEQWITNVNIVLFVSSNFSCISHHSSYGVYSTSIMQTSMIYIENLTKFHLFLIIYFREVSKFYLNHNCFPSGTLWNISSFPFYTLVGEALMMTVSFTRVKDTTSSFQPSIPHLPSPFILLSWWQYLSHVWDPLLQRLRWLSGSMALFLPIKLVIIIDEFSARRLKKTIKTFKYFCFVKYCFKSII